MKKCFLSFLFSLWMITSGFSQAKTNVGTDFWIAFPPNTFLTQSISLFIASNFVTSGSLYSAFPGVTQNFTVVPGIVTQIILPNGVQLGGGLEDKGIRVTSNDPVSVYGLSYYTNSTDAFLALPVNALGTDYRIITYKASLATFPSAFSIVATQNGTSLTIFNHQTNSTTNVNLDQGQSWLVEADGIDADVTGSRVQSNFPVAVFGSVKEVNIPSIDCWASDYIVEMMFPYYSWGKNYVTVPLAGRDNSGDIFRVVAGEDGTDISVNGSLVSTINAGDYYETNLTGYNSITASKAVLLAQFAKGEYCSGGITGDPLMMLIPPCEQFLTSYTVVNVSGFQTHWINVVAPQSALGTIFQDGVLIPDSVFTQISTTNFYGAQRSVIAGSHTFTSTFPFGVFVYGWGDINSYGYPGGCSLSPIGTVNSVTLLPDTAYGQLNITNVCLTANVTDNLLNPVEGVLVNFYVSGINPFTGNGYTDSLGNAQYCYTQTGIIPGEDYIYAEIFGFKSDTSVVFWSYLPPCVNPTDGGIIGNNQSGCGSFTPSALTNLILPTGQTGTLEYKWQLSTTSDSTGFTDIPGSNDSSYNPGIITQTNWYKRIARVNCMSDWSGAVESNVIEITIIDPLPVNVSIVASDNNVCAGSQVTYTATPVNPGTSPVYQWKVNGIIVGSNSLSYSYPPINGDIVTCTLTSSELCTSNNPALSNPVLMIVNSLLTVGCSISASANPVCAGIPVTFTAIPTNGGSSPTYQWKVNGVIVGTNGPLYTYIPANGDLVNCNLTSNLLCTTNNPAISNTIAMVINNSLPAGVSIVANPNPFCPGTSVNYTATPANGGSTPVYQWKVNGISSGTNSPNFLCSPQPGDSIWCIMTSNLTCVSGNPATSNKVMMVSLPVPVITLTYCFDSITTINAKPIGLKGGIPLGGTYSGPGVNSVTGVFTPSAAGIGTKTIIYSYTNASLCTANKSKTIIVQASPVFACGNNLSDIRDNNVYPTVLIGSQCWMAANLNYGIMIFSSSHQRDNCLPEKYCYNDLTSNCQTGTSSYQWDELMLYSDTPGQQGLCPPNWHVPTDVEWDALFANWTNSSFAGAPLKYSGFSGFNALLSGVRLQNVQWNFQNFATFFWSSTPYGVYKAWAQGMNSFNPSVSLYPSSRTNAYSLRCLKD